MPDVIPTGPTFWKIDGREVTVCRVSELLEIEIFMRPEVQIWGGALIKDSGGNSYVVEKAGPMKTNFANARLLVRKLYPSQPQD